MIYVLEGGTRVTILDGPRVADGYHLSKLEADDGEAHLDGPPGPRQPHVSLPDDQHLGRAVRDASAQPVREVGAGAGRRRPACGPVVRVVDDGCVGHDGVSRVLNQARVRARPSRNETEGS